MAQQKETPEEIVALRAAVLALKMRFPDADFLLLVSAPHNLEYSRFGFAITDRVPIEEYIQFLVETFTSIGEAQHSAANAVKH